MAMLTTRSRQLYPLAAIIEAAPSLLTVGAQRKGAPAEVQLNSINLPDRPGYGSEGGRCVALKLVGLSAAPAPRGEMPAYQ